MSAQIARQIRITRENKARTLIADFESKTGVASDGQHVEFLTCFAQWGWFNVDTGERVEICSGITWINLSDEE